jgi:pyruvate kinase
MTIESLCDCTVKASFDIKTEAIFLISDNEFCCRTLSKYRPNCPIYSIVSRVELFNSIRLIRGVVPILLENKEEELKDEDLIKYK